MTGSENGSGRETPLEAAVIQITPFMYVRDLEAALDFWCGTLGFRIGHREPGYAYVALPTESGGHAAVRILEDRNAHLFEGGRDRFAYYLDVRDVDAIHAALKPKLDAMGPRDVHGPADKEYGQRELLIRAPDGQLVVFGQAIR
jgi:catechol 2,3-dioxygenase-like lactoylglutathione lyase family enzyme